MALKVENVSKSFGEKKAVNNISFTIDKPGVFGLLGTNGAGKTTTIRMILGIITKDRGTITWNGKEVKRKHVNFGYMPEERGVYPKSKVIDQLLYFAELKGMKRQEAQQAIDKWLKRLHMEEYKMMAAEKLSKGNQQKIQFIIAVMNDPELVILDEPFSGLDPVNTEQLKEVILELVQEGKYIVMSGHQMSSIEEFCRDILILNRGKTVLKGNLKEIKDSYPARTIEVSCNQNIEEEIKQVGLTIQNEVNYHYTLNIGEEKQGEELFQLLAQKRIPITKFEIKKPSLHDIFIEKVEEGGDK
ncbi:MAG: ABC transporter ATP-binding protein [Clostridia bacterium]